MALFSDMMDEAGDLRSEIAQLKAELREARQAILKEGMARNDAVAALKPFAEVADACDYFKNLPGHHICSWRIKGERVYGPTADDCRHARTIVLRAARPVDAVGREGQPP